MFNDLQGLGLGLVFFALIIGVGSIVLYTFAGATARCTTDKTWNATDGTCSNTTGTATPTGDAYTSSAYLLGQLGSSGLAGWTPAIIAISIGMLFIGGFLMKGGSKKKGRY
jgi:hypothetical protein